MEITNRRMVRTFLTTSETAISPSVVTMLRLLAAGTHAHRRTPWGGGSASHVGGSALVSWLIRSSARSSTAAGTPACVCMCASEECVNRSNSRRRGRGMLGVRETHLRKMRHDVLCTVRCVRAKRSVQFFVHVDSRLRKQGRGMLENAGMAREREKDRERERNRERDRYKYIYIYIYIYIYERRLAMHLRREGIQGGMHIGRGCCRQQK